MDLSIIHTRTHAYTHIDTRPLDVCKYFKIKNRNDIYFYTLFVTHNRVVVGLIPMRNYTVKSNLQVTVVDD